MTTTTAPVGARLVGLVRATHAGPTVVVTALAGAVAAGAGAGAGRAVLVSVAVLLGQVSIGWSNDAVDAGRDLAVGRSDKPVVRGLVTATTLWRAALIVAAACAVVSFTVGVPAGLVHVAAVASAWAYNLTLKSTPWSWVPYGVSFGLLPAFCVLGAGGARPAVWALGTGALLGLGAHLVNVLPDLDDDAATGVRGLPHRLGRTASAVAAPAFLLAGVVVAVVGSGRVAAEGDPGAAGWSVLVASVAAVLAAGAGVVAVLRPRSRAPFGLTMAVAGLCVVLLVTGGDRLVAAAG